MPTYVALLRGIMPMNPNMRGAKLKEVFESLRLKNVTPVIASGNIVFTTNAKDISSLETKIEKAMKKDLGFMSTTIIRSENEIKKLIKKNPFKGVVDEKPNYLVVTFFKNRSKEVPTVIDLSSKEATAFMQGIDKKHGKSITTRTWKTVGRIMKVMEKMCA